jgi:hypothetical protein
MDEAFIKHGGDEKRLQNFKYKILLKRQLGRPSRRREDSIKINIKWPVAACYE